MIERTKIYHCLTSSWFELKRGFLGSSDKNGVLYFRHLVIISQWIDMRRLGVTISNVGQ